MARPRSEAARAKMLEATMETVIEHGVHGFTVDEVARRSGVAKTTIYRHFSSGNELLVSALDCMVAAFPVVDTGSLRGDLVAFLHQVVPTMSQSALRPVMLDLLSAAARDEELAKIHASLVAERMLPLRHIFDQAKQRGEVDAELDFDIAFDFVEGPFMSRWMLRPDSLDDVDLEDTVDRILAAVGSTG